ASFRDTWLYHSSPVVLLWLALPIARWSTWRYPFELLSWWRILAAHLSVAAAVVIAAWLASALRLLLANQLPFGQLPWILRDTFTWDDLAPNLLAYGALVLPFYARDFYHNWQVKQREAAELQLANAQLETRFVRASLDALKMQLHPHFLFNTLNSITALIRRNRSREAEDIVAGLGELLRRSLEHKQDLKKTLEDELKFLRRYFEIESIRFQDRLRVEIEIAPDCRSALVPSLILQPLVENAMKHGFSKDPEARLLRITAAHERDWLKLAVFNEGPALAPGENSSAGHGIGTQNTRTRLRMMYGDDAGLVLRNIGSSGVSAEIHLPFQTQL
ncbi:MAG TPA: histidine kinase, partial [Candidatus Didemnitutus sp.]|nr:histidine kinase [Candidatus Didemnitutus sp.]